MIITLSPAKILDFDSEVTTYKTSEPLFLNEAKELYSSVQGLSIDEIASLMNVNPQLALSSYEYIQTFDLPKTPLRQAAFAYNGIAYQGLDAKTLTDDDWTFAQRHLLHISGLYGFLRPLDVIKPYRLEMQIKLRNEKGKDLYDFWREKLSKHMAVAMQGSSNVWINLSSKEYTKVIDRKLLPVGHRVITPIFKEHKGSGYKQIVVYAKKARGMMTRFIIQNRIENPEYIKAFNVAGYSYSEPLSTAEEWVFIR